MSFKQSSEARYIKTQLQAIATTFMLIEQVIGELDETNNVTTVAHLPTTAIQGQRAVVTDATAPTFLSTLTGGGTVVCPVMFNGTHWVAA
jgi:hypothetical protein